MPEYAKPSPPTAEHRRWIESQLDAARDFVPRHSPMDADNPLSIGALDRALAGWFASHGETDDAAAVDDMANALGATFGQLLVEHVNFQWVLVGDDSAGELAVHALPGAGDVLIFPFELLTKRYKTTQQGFLKDTYHSISSHVKSLTVTDFGEGNCS